jgi:hypothetical protein
MLRVGLISDTHGLLRPGPRRFKLPIAAGELIVQGTEVSARIVEF